MGQIEPAPRHANAVETELGAARAIGPRARSLERLCLDVLADGPATCEEICAGVSALRGRQILLFSIRPRLSQLRAKGVVEGSGERGRSISGMKAMRWRIVQPAQGEMFAGGAR